MHRRIQIAVQPENMELLIVLVLVNSLERDLDDTVDHLGDFLANR
jgi:hypothetical protein